MSYRVYLFKEQFRRCSNYEVSSSSEHSTHGVVGRGHVGSRSFVDRYRKVLSHRDSIIVTLTNNHGLANASVKLTHTKLSLLTRMAYGLRSTVNLLALCRLDRGRQCPRKPGH